MNCIVTGGTGLIGTSLIERLLSENHQVTSIVHNNSVDKFLGHEGYNQYVCDLSNPKKLSMDFLNLKTDAVIHLVQSNRYKEFPDFADDIFYTNVNSTFCMLEYARKHGIKTFILASSGGIYGFGEKSFSEDDAIVKSADLGFYITTKMCAEALAENYKDYMNIIILRFFFVYGKNSKNTMLLPRLISSIYNHKSIILQGTQGLSINPIYVDDAVEAITKSIKLKQSCCVNIAGKEVITLLELSNKIGNELGIMPDFKIEKKPPKNLVADTSRMKLLFGESKIPLNVGIKRLISSMKNRGVL